MNTPTLLNPLNRPVRALRLVPMIAAALLVAACAHPMAIGPDIARV